MKLTPIDLDMLSIHLLDKWEVPTNETDYCAEKSLPPTTDMETWLAIWWMQTQEKIVIDRLGRQWRWKNQHPKVRLMHESTGKMVWFDNSNFWFSGPFRLEAQIPSKKFILYDGRDTDKASVLVMCSSMKEAKSYKGEYGDMVCYSYDEVDGKLINEKKEWYYAG